MIPTSGFDLLSAWLEKIDLFSDGYDLVLDTRALQDAPTRKVFDSAFHNDPLTRHWASFPGILGMPPEPVARMRIKYLATLEDVTLLDRAIERLEEEVRIAENRADEYARALSALAYARTERFLVRVWGSHVVQSQPEARLTPEDFDNEAEFCRRGLKSISCKDSPQEAGILAYNRARLLELRSADTCREALEYFLFAIRLFHETVEEDLRIFNAQRFIPHQRELWACFASAIRLAVFVDRRDLAVCLTQAIKFGRSPISIFSPAMAQLEYLPDHSLSAKVYAEAGLSSRIGQSRPSSHHFPPTIQELAKFLSPQNAILEIYRHSDALILTLLDRNGIQCVGIPIAEIYQRCPSLHRLVRLTETDFSLDEERASWVLDYPQVAIVPSAAGQWATKTNLLSLAIPFVVGLEAFNELYGVVFKKLDEYLVSRGITKLSISLDGTLSLVPFAAMVDDTGEFLLNRYSFSYVPNLATLLWCLTNSRAIIRSATLIQDLSGSLRLTSEEIRSIAGCLGSAAVKMVRTPDGIGSLLDDLSVSDLLHFACHGTFDIRRPEKSGIVLDSSHALSADEVSKHGLKLGSLAVLSACETAHSNVSEKYGVPGLAHAFLRAGVTTVVASLWKVPDIAAYLLMVKMYEILFEGGLDVSEALAVAQRWLRNLDVEEARSYGPQKGSSEWAELIDEEMMRAKRFFLAFGREGSISFRTSKKTPDLNRPFSNPYYWAGFTVIGDWRNRRVE